MEDEYDTAVCLFYVCNVCCEARWNWLSLVGLCLQLADFANDVPLMQLRGEEESYGNA
jgi:hypothetical protein